jgi:hypothetical protein
MANSDTPFGLKPIGNILGSPYSAKIVPCYVDAAYETALFIGDPVIVDADGSNAAVESRIGGTFDIGTLPSVQRATVTDGGLISGVVVGIAPSTQDSLPYSPADTEGVVYVNMDPFTEYLIQVDGALAATSVGLNAVGIYTHSGSTTTGLSGLELDSGTTTAPSADASNPFTIVRTLNAPDNEPNTIHQKVIVRINGSTHVTLGVIGI